MSLEDIPERQHIWQAYAPRSKEGVEVLAWRIHQELVNVLEAMIYAEYPELRDDLVGVGEGDGRNEKEAPFSLEITRAQVRQMLLQIGNPGAELSLRGLPLDDMPHNFDPDGEQDIEVCIKNIRRFMVSLPANSLRQSLPPNRHGASIYLPEFMKNLVKIYWVKFINFCLYGSYRLHL